MERLHCRNFVRNQPHLRFNQINAGFISKYHKD
jgi:hypothetical protein